MKKLFIFGGLAAAFFAFRGVKKGFDIKKVLENLESSISKIDRPSFTWQRIKLDVDISLFNPTDTPLDLSTGGLIKVTKVRIYDSASKLLGTATTNLDAISIPARGTTVIKRVPIEAPLSSVLSTFVTGSTNFDDYTIVAEIEALGNTYQI